MYALVVDNDKGLFELSLKNLTWHYSFELFQAFQSVSVCATHGTRKLCHDNVGGLFELSFQEPDLALLSKPLSISSCQFELTLVHLCSIHRARELIG